MLILLKATFNNISVLSWRLVLLMKKTKVQRENHRPFGSHWQFLTREMNVLFHQANFVGEFWIVSVILRNISSSDNSSSVWYALIAHVVCQSIYHTMTITTTLSCCMVSLKLVYTIYIKYWYYLCDKLIASIWYWY